MTRVLRNRDFRLLWLGHSVSSVGDRLLTIALALYVIDLTGRASDLGIVLAANMLPFVAFILLGGVWSDRLARKRVMIVSDLVRFGLHGTLAILVWAEAAEIWHLVALGAASGLASAFFKPAAGGLVPQTVPEDEVQEANGLVGFSNNAAEFAGPALATALVLGAGAATAFALDAVSFLVSAACLAGVHARERGEPVAAGRFVDDLRAGYVAVRSRAWVWVTIVVFSAAVMVCLAPWYVLGPVVAEDVYDRIGIYGVVSSALGLGTVIGTLVAVRWRPQYPMRLAFVLCLAWPAATALYAAGLPLALVTVAMAVAGAGLALFEVFWLTALAHRVPPHLLSRVTSYDYMGSLLFLPLGYLLAGPAADALGAQEVLLGGSVLATVCLALGLLPRETRQLERIEPTDAQNSGVPSSGVEASA